MTTCGDIITAVNRYAPLSLQENWDNSGIQVGDVTADSCLTAHEVADLIATSPLEFPEDYPYRKDV